MRSEILKLVYDYSTKGKLADHDFIYKLIMIVTSKKGTANYVKSLIFDNGNDTSYSTYDVFEHQIIVHDRAISYFFNHKYSIDFELQNYEKIMWRNLKVAQIILHELEHAYQSKVFDENNNIKIEDKIINICLQSTKYFEDPIFLKQMQTGEVSVQETILKLLKIKKMYEQCYNFNPLERMAQIKSLNLLVLSLEMIQHHIPKLYSYEKNNLLVEMLNGYSEYGKCPTHIYLHAIDKLDEWQKFSFYHDNEDELESKVRIQYKLAKRLTLGLPISHGEFLYLQSKI